MKNQKVSLTAEDRKTIRYERRMGYIFAVLILTAGAFINLVLLLLQPGQFQMLVFIDAGILALSVFVLIMVNRKHNKDLKNGEKVLKEAALQAKKQETSYEAGSGMLYIPILGDIFPRVWGQKMRPAQKYFFKVEGERHEVDEQTFNSTNAGDPVFLHFSLYGHNLLGISTKKK
ncbi:MAG: hypothetical protein PF489_02170 [Salinivirgaceae bacterium]|jgi:hypothetical protein|nr:hypothetical protein [Salinivirgaceae bacterium]